MNEVCGPTTVQQTLCYRYHQSTISMHPIISNILTCISLFLFLSLASCYYLFIALHSFFLLFLFFHNFPSSFSILQSALNLLSCKHIATIWFLLITFSNELRKDRFIITKGRLEPIVFSKSFEISLQYSHSRLYRSMYFMIHHLGWS